jgi:hypothetical protein
MAWAQRPSSYFGFSPANTQVFALRANKHLLCTFPQHFLPVSYVEYNSQLLVPYFISIPLHSENGYQNTVLTLESGFLEEKVKNLS